MLSRYIRYRTVIRAILGLLIFQLLAAVAFAQRGLEPQWVYFAPEEIGAAAAFLASPLSGYTSGSVVTIDAGLSARATAF